MPAAEPGPSEKVLFVPAAFAFAWPLGAATLPFFPSFVDKRDADEAEPPVSDELGKGGASSESCSAKTLLPFCAPFAGLSVPTFDVCGLRASESRDADAALPGLLMPKSLAVSAFLLPAPNTSTAAVLNWFSAVSALALKLPFVFV